MEEQKTLSDRVVKLVSGFDKPIFRYDEEDVKEKMSLLKEDLFKQFNEDGMTILSIDNSFNEHIGERLLK